MALSDKDRRILSGLLVVDKTFREDFLKNPKGAAASMGIALSDEDHQEALKYVNELRKAAEAGVGAMKGMHAAGGLFPSWLIHVG